MKHDIDLAKEMGIRNGTAGRKLEGRYGIRMRGRRIINFDFNRTTVAAETKFRKLTRSGRLPTEQIVYIAPRQIGPGKNYHGNRGDTFQHLVINKWLPRQEWDEAKKEWYTVEGEYFANGVLNVFIKASDQGIVTLHVCDLGLSGSPKRDRLPTPQIAAPNKNIELISEQTDVPVMSGHKDGPITGFDGKILYEWLHYYKGHYGLEFGKVGLIKDRLLLLEALAKKEKRGKETFHYRYRKHLDMMIIGNYEVEEKDIW